VIEEENHKRVMAQHDSRLETQEAFIVNLSRTEYTLECQLENIMERQGMRRAIAPN